MSLLRLAMKPCTLFNKKQVSDGQGGFHTTWEAGATFEAAVAVDTSIQARVAESQGVRNIYTVTVDRSLRLDFHDVFRNDLTGQFYRVTSKDDRETPVTSTMNMRQVNAEDWDFV